MANSKVRFRPLNVVEFLQNEPLRAATSAIPATKNNQSSKSSDNSGPSEVEKYEFARKAIQAVSRAWSSKTVEFQNKLTNVDLGAIATMPWDNVEDVQKWKDAWLKLLGTSGI